MKLRIDSNTGKRYLSMEQFFACLYQQRAYEDRFDVDYIFAGHVKIDEVMNGYDRDQIRSVIRRFLDICSQMGIDCSLYMIGNCYRITEHVADLFCYIELFSFPCISKKLRIKSGKECT